MRYRKEKRRPWTLRSTPAHLIVARGHDGVKEAPIAQLRGEEPAPGRWQVEGVGDITH